MSNPNFSVKHVATRSKLPQVLTQGRAYFIEDEGSIVINHGDGAVTYADSSMVRAHDPVITSHTQQLADISPKVATHEFVQPHILNSLRRSDYLPETLPGEKTPGYSGTALGPVITEAHSTAIRNRTYQGLSLSKSWVTPSNFPFTWTDGEGEEHEDTMRSVSFRIVNLGNYYGTGSPSLIPSGGGIGGLSGYVVCLTQESMFSAPMDDALDKRTGYGECALRKSDAFRRANAFIKAWAGDHFIEFYDWLPNAVDENGYVTGWGKYLVGAEVPTAEMMGYHDPHTNGFCFTGEPLDGERQSHYCMRMKSTWLRTQSGAGKYLYMDGTKIYPRSATSSGGVRLVFCIH